MQPLSVQLAVFRGAHALSCSGKVATLASRRPAIAHTLRNGRELWCDRPRRCTEEPLASAALCTCRAMQRRGPSRRPWCTVQARAAFGGEASAPAQQLASPVRKRGPGCVCVCEGHCRLRSCGAAVVPQGSLTRCPSSPCSSGAMTLPPLPTRKPLAGSSQTALVCFSKKAVVTSTSSTWPAHGLARLRGLAGLAAAPGPPLPHRWRCS
jgi:hypothetical protein